MHEEYYSQSETVEGPHKELLGTLAYYVGCFLVVAIVAAVLRYRIKGRLCCRTNCSLLGRSCCRYLSGIQCRDKRHYYRETLMDALMRLKCETVDYSGLQKELSKNITFSDLMMGMNLHLAHFCFRYFPSGSMAEGYGAWWNSVSLLASDVDLMLIPSGSGLVAGKDCPEYLFHIEGRKHFEELSHDNPDNYIMLKLNQTHPASDRWKSMCNVEKVDKRTGQMEFYLSNTRIRIALVNALREDFYTRTLKTHRDRNINIESKGPSLNVKVWEEIKRTDKLGKFIRRYCSCSCSCRRPLAILGYCFACLISPLFLIIPTYELIVGKNACTGKPRRRGRRKPQTFVDQAETQTDQLVAFDVDFVFALPIEWPEDIWAEWTERHFNCPWLSEKDIEELTKKQQNYVVPKPPRSLNTLTAGDTKEQEAGWDIDGAFYKIGRSTEGSSGNDWRLSFSKQEKYLANLIARKWPSLHLGYLGVKAAVKMVVRELDVQLPSYTVKTAFLHFMDTLDEETLDELSVLMGYVDSKSCQIEGVWVHEVVQGRNVQLPPHPAEWAFTCFLRFFIERLEGSNVPHYFVRTTELAKDLEVQEKEKVLRELRQVLNDPIVKLGMRKQSVERGCCCSGSKKQPPTFEACVPANVRTVGRAGYVELNNMV